MSDDAAHDGPVTFLNIFEIPREDIETFKTGWHERVQLMANAPGFRDAQLLEATSSDERFQLVNLAHWDSEQAWRDANQNPNMQAAVQRVGGDPHQRVRPNLGLYRPAVTVDKSQ